MHSTSSTYVLASQQEATHVTVRLDVLRLSLPDATAASLYLVFTGDPAPQSLQRVGELLLPRVRLHLDAEVTGADEYASHVFTDISSALGSRVQLDALALCVVGMLLRLEFLLLYVAFTQPSYLRSLVCESLYVLCSAALSGSASLQEPDSALGFLVLHGSHGVHDSDVAAGDGASLHRRLRRHGRPTRRPARAGPQSVQMVTTARRRVHTPQRKVQVHGRASRARLGPAV